MTPAELVQAILDLADQLNDLTDEIIRLRATMPADALREYDRRKSS